MQTMTFAKTLTARRTSAVFAEKAWMPSLAPNEGIRSLDDAMLALIEAERVIRTQAERITHLEDLAMTDELTGLANRRGFVTSINRELAAAKRDPSAAGVLVMIDLDGFKSINDRFGHAVGDDYLKGVAQTLASLVRASDVVARLGGDEFAVLFPRMHEKLGLQRLAKLEQDFNARSLRCGDRGLPLRASFGLASYKGGDRIDDLLANADVKLYAHKASRRA